MNKSIAFLLLLGLGLVWVGCDKDDDDDPQGYEYHAHIHSPSQDTLQAGETMDIEVEFEDHNGGTVHHINVSIYYAADSTAILYSKPDDAHVHATSGEHTFTGQFVLDAVPAGSDLVLRARVWGDNGLEDEEISYHPFHVE